MVANVMNRKDCVRVSTTVCCFLALLVAVVHLNSFAASVPPTSPNIQHLRERSRSSMILRSGAQAVEVFLYAADERIEILRGTYCGGEEGHKQYEGNYKLFSVTNNSVISSLDSGDLTFTEGRIEGLQIFRVPKRTEPLIAVYQYQGCNGDRVELFRVDDRGRLFRAYFQNKDGSKDVAIGHGFGAPEPPTSPLGFCH